MKKIAVITTGGTIGAALGDKSVTIDQNAQHLKAEIDFAKRQLNCEVELYSPFGIASENLHPRNWHDLLTAVDRANRSACDGIVITHGTDTLEYSVAAILSYRQLWAKKICFTGAYYPPNHLESDVSINLQGALAWVCADSPKQGVAVSFCSEANNQTADILNGFGLKSMLYDERHFASANGSFARYQSPGGLSFQKALQQASPQLGIEKIPNQSDIDQAVRSVALVKLYPGIDRDFIEAAAAGREVLVLQGYHCGTGPADENSDLAKFISENSHRMQIFMGGYPSEFIDLPYDSTLELMARGLTLYKNIPAYYLYIFSVLGLAAGHGTKQLVRCLSSYKLNS